MSQHILSINCSNARWTTLGLLDGTAVSGEMNLELGKRQSSILPSLVDFFLGTFSLRVDDVDFFAVVTGPGSFTGLKVAVAFTQFLAWASGEKPIIPLSSLECLAYTILDRSKQPVCPLLWAGGGKVYSALFIPGAAGKPQRSRYLQRRTTGRSFWKPCLSQERKFRMFSSFPIPLKNAADCFPAAFPVLLKLHLPGELQTSFLRDCTNIGPSPPGLSQRNIFVSLILADAFLSFLSLFRNRDKKDKYIFAVELPLAKRYPFTYRKRLLFSPSAVF